MAYALTRKCRTCPVVFAANSNKQTYCKPCAKERRQASRPKWNQKYNMKNAEQKNAESRAYNKSDKGRAAQKLRDAIRQGKIIRQPCEVCGEPDAQGHHTDYSKPYDVKWLCAQHHREEHLFEPWQNDLRRGGYKGGFELSQLIEACKPARIMLTEENPDDWFAFANTSIYRSAPTPVEAMANLWIALHDPS